jgi:AraC-like DNA-binding protein
MAPVLRYDVPLTGEKAKEYVKRFIELSAIEYAKHHDVAYYADVLDISYNHLNDLVRRSTGVSAKQYLLRLIVAEACRLLREEKKHPREVADVLHFDNYSYFNRFFKTQTGFTPDDYVS